MCSELSDVSADPGRSPDNHSAVTTISEQLRVACFFVRIREMRNPRSKGRTPD
ncbi:hypothetical protein GA0115244_11131 [Streptomyces sp. DvalAA-19]|nr:hypothetical protein GA0115244_11131 [Streptomyces sp. DvalAA-19]